MKINIGIWTVSTVLSTLLLVSCMTDSSTPWNASDVCPDAPGTLLDERDGKSYKTVKIGTQTWMAENLNYATGNSFCYENADNNCIKHGRLYDWSTARTACPAGWHIPSNDEWQALVDGMGGFDDAGIRMKARSDWEYNGTQTGNGSDDCGFSAFPSGSYSGTKYWYLGFQTDWWSEGKDENMQVEKWGLNYGYSKVYLGYGYKSEGNSLRCVLD